MKNITVTVDDTTYRHARLCAAQQDTSVSALVKGFLTSLSQGESEFERLRREEMGLREQVVEFRGDDRLSRDALHERDA